MAPSMMMMMTAVGLTALCSFNFGATALITNRFYCRRDPVQVEAVLIQLLPALARKLK